MPRPPASPYTFDDHTCRDRGYDPRARACPVCCWQLSRNSMELQAKRAKKPLGEFIAERVYSASSLEKAA